MKTVIRFQPWDNPKFGQEVVPQGFVAVQGMAHLGHPATPYFVIRNEKSGLYYLTLSGATRSVDQRVINRAMAGVKAVGRPPSYLMQMLVLKPQAIYSAATAASAAARGESAAQALRVALNKRLAYLRQAGSVPASDGMVRIAGQAPTPGWNGLTWWRIVTVSPDAQTDGWSSLGKVKGGNVVFELFQREGSDDEVKGVKTDAETGEVISSCIIQNQDQMLEFWADFRIKG